MPLSIEIMVQLHYLSPTKRKELMREDIVILKVPLVRIDKQPINRWVQRNPYDYDAHTVLDGKYHPKLTYFYVGDEKYTNKYARPCYAYLYDLYGRQQHWSPSTACRLFPPQEQLHLITGFGEILLEVINEEKLEKIIQEIKKECII